MGKLILLIAYLVVASSCFVLENIEYIANFSLLHLIITVFVLVLCCKRKADLIILYVVILFIFNCGQLYNSVYGNDEYNILAFDKYGGFAEIKKAFCMYIWFSSILVTSAIVFLLNKKRNFFLQNENNDIKSLSRFGKLLISIGIIPRLYIDIGNLYTSINYGYMESFNVYIPLIVQSLAFLFEIGMLSLLLSNKNNSQRSRQILVMITFYEMMVMISGHRYFSITYLIAVYAYVVKLNNIKLITVVKCMIFGICILVILNIISAVRLNAGYSFTEVIDGLYNGIATLSNSIYQALGEFGSAFSSVVIAVTQTGSNVSYGLGLSYIMSVILIIPGFGSLLPMDISSNAVYITKLQNSTYLGGSFIGEAYFNFGFAGICVAIIFGKILSSCQIAIDKENNNIWQKLFYIIIFVELLICIRGYVSMVTQPIMLLYISMIAFNRCGNKYVIKHNNPCV